MNLIRQILKEDLASSDVLRPNSPTIWEALAVKRMLSTLPLNLELVETIMDFADYWPCTCTKMKDSVVVLSDDNVAIMDFYSILIT